MTGLKNPREFYGLVIFDRDGVVNVAPKEGNRYILSNNELILNPVVIEYIVKLQNQGIFTCVATNQQGVGKGLISPTQLSEIHDKINDQIVNLGGKKMEFFICTHLVEIKCNCRKPEPGLLIQALKFFGVEPSKTIFIGDQHTDKMAAEAANIDFLLVDNIYF